jgi:hypothetical protein
MIGEGRHWTKHEFQIVTSRISKRLYTHFGMLRYVCWVERGLLILRGTARALWALTYAMVEVARGYSIIGRLFGKF